jgi:hypothetical protein
MPALVALVTPPAGTPAHAAGPDGGAALVPLSELAAEPGGGAGALRRGTHGGKSVFLALQPDSEAEEEEENNAAEEEEEETQTPAAGSKLLRALAASSQPAQPPATPLPPLSAEAAAALADVAALRAAGNAAFAAGQPEEALESYGQARCGGAT